MYIKNRKNKFINLKYQDFIVSVSINQFLIKVQ